MIDGNSGSLDVRFYNNTLYDAFLNFGTVGNVSRLEVKNNIIYDPNDTPIQGSSRITSQGNNQTSNPGFKNTSNLPEGFSGTYGVDLAPKNDGLMVPSGSAIDGGVALGSTYAYSINSVRRPVGLAWDIGAYEGTGATVPLPPRNLRVVPPQ
jgi:hypothetical protein